MYLLTFACFTDKVQDIHIDGLWATTGGEGQERFLFYDNIGQDDARIVMFGTDRCLKLLANSEKWFMDGTFSMAPKQFAQVSLTLIIIDGG